MFDRVSNELFRWRCEFAVDSPVATGLGLQLPASWRRRSPQSTGPETGIGSTPFDPGTKLSTQSGQLQSRLETALGDAMLGEGEGDGDVGGLILSNARDQIRVHDRSLIHVQTRPLKGGVLSPGEEVTF